MTNTMRIGFIGLGNMGRPMASNFVRKGFRVCVHDVVPAPVRALEALGANRRPTYAAWPRRADVVFTMLPDSRERARRSSAGAAA